MGTVNVRYLVGDVPSAVRFQAGNPIGLFEPRR
jgi:hypothetical protein